MNVIPITSSVRTILSCCAVTMLALLAIGTLVPSRSEARDIGPDADFCSAINSTPPGEEVVLAPGEYQGPCAIRQGGERGMPLVIRAADPKRRPRIVYGGTTANVLEVKASHVTIRGLEFAATQQDVDVVRIFKANNVTVEDCVFTGVGGIAVVANHSSLHGLVVRQNVIRDSQATAMYFGCHDGSACSITGIVIEGNFIDGVTAPEPQVGYGIEIKLNSVAVIRDNIVMNTKGPGIMVYGSRNPAEVNLVERNLTMGSRTSSGILVGGGPVIVRNNISVANEEAGIGLEDYKKRGLLRSVAVVNNTLYKNKAGAIVLPEAGFSGVILLNNAAHAGAAPRAFPPARTGVRMGGNIDCTAMACFGDPEQQDFSPHAASFLRGAGVLWGDPALMPREDFFGNRRSSPPTAGAIERPSGPIPLRAQQ
jgi:hypothetical protein